ncbi:MAG: hydroxyacid dehydrogenase [Candidatus Magasanikbacteria bacterium]|nr:hydroxyacid dehydrogenase [Candidatus Magasanikbacteria bacterium]
MPKNKPKAVFYTFVPDMNDYLKSKTKKLNVKIINEPLNKKNIDPKTEILGVFVDSKVNKEVLDKLPELKMITTFSTGYDNVDIKEAKKRGIPVCNVPTYGENTVAQHAMALILTLSRRIFVAAERAKHGIYDYHGLRGFDLKDKTVGVVGTGHIGIYLIKMLKGFEVDVIAYDAFPKKSLQKKHGFKYVSTLNTLLSKSDIISMHVPLFPSTYHMINTKNIKKIKKGSYIINTARGGLIEPKALLWALETNRINGAGLDVFEDEELIDAPKRVLNKIKDKKKLKNNEINHKIINHPNTVVTPHSAFNSTEAIKRIIDTAVDNVNAYLSGKRQNDVT